MKEFPLYDTLIKDVDDKELSVKYKKDLLKNIGKINDKGHELLYVLIKIYSMEHEDEKLEIPYKGKFTSLNDLEFDLENLPNQLKQMINRFINLHLKVMKEEINR